MSSHPPTFSPRLSRRALLRGLGALGLTATLVACGEGRRSRDGQDEGGGQDATDGTEADMRQVVLDELGVTAPLNTVIVVPMAEFVAGRGERFVFGLATPEREFLTGLDVQVAVVRDDPVEVVEEPVPARSFDEEFGELGVYAADLSYPEPGIYRVVVFNEERAAVQAIQVIDPEDSNVPQVGQQFPSDTTPTVQSEQDLQELCTRDPDCTMHDHSLDEALAAGRPIVLTVATPAYCQTAICGPVVDVVEEVKQSAGRDDVAWIHVEVFKDAGNTPLEFVTETLQLPSEPWTFFIGADGDLVDRIQGPTPAPLVQESLERL